jgi:hypothetical protein
MEEDKLLYCQFLFELKLFVEGRQGQYKHWAEKCSWDLSSAIENFILALSEDDSTVHKEIVRLTVAAMQEDLDISYVPFLRLRTLLMRLRRSG